MSTQKPDNCSERDKELDTYGFSTPASRRGLLYTAFSLLLLAIVILARQIGIERKRTDLERESKQELQEEMYNRLYSDMQKLLQAPKSQIQDAVTKVDSAAEKVRTAAEKLENKK